MWFDTLLIVYHGCSEKAADSLLANGLNAINLTIGRVGLDFGKGFYTTTSPDQAASWAGYKGRRD